MTFYIGIHRPPCAIMLQNAFISVNVLKNRKSDFKANSWILDSGAFTQVANSGDFTMSVEEYARHIRRWRNCGNLVAAVAQDYMCEPSLLEKYGKTVTEQQRMTIERYDALRRENLGGVYLLPVLQGYQLDDYLSHLNQYGERLRNGMYVGVGSVCSRNNNYNCVQEIIRAILLKRPDLKLHGFGLKYNALYSAKLWDMLTSADSMAWSYEARMAGRDPNNPQEALDYERKIKNQVRQEFLDI